jgi:hypothetical protein
VSTAAASKILGIDRASPWSDIPKKVILVAGANIASARRHDRLPGRRGRTAPLIVLDPRMTPIAHTASLSSRFARAATSAC